MATKSCQAQAPVMSAEDRAAGGRGRGRGSRVPTGSLPPPRRGQIKEKIIKNVVAAVANKAAGLFRGDKNGGSGLPVADNADEK